MLIGFKVFHSVKYMLCSKISLKLIKWVSELNIDQILYSSIYSNKNCT